MRVVCIDDEHLSLNYIKRQLERLENINVIGTFTNPLEGKNFILKEVVDVVFLDIEMPPLNGMEIAAQILKKRPNVIIIFVTAFASFAVDAFEINAMDYLVKPVRFDRLQITINRIEEQLKARGKDGAPSTNKLKIRIAPSLAFEEEPNVFKALAWRTSKTQELFIYLLQNNGVIIEKSAIIDLLWDEYNLEKAYSLLYTTIYNIRKQIKPYEPHIVLHNRSYGYLLELQEVEIDLVHWEEELEGLPEMNSASIGAYEKTMQKYSGVYLSDYDYTWLEAERHRLEKLWFHTAKQIALFYVQTKKLTEAIRWYDTIAHHYPAIEEIHFELMKLYEANGEFTLMMQQYNTLHKICRENFDGKPSQHILDWYIEKLR